MNFETFGFDVSYCVARELRSPYGAPTLQIMPPTAGMALGSTAATSRLPHFVVEVTPDQGATWIGLVEGGSGGGVTGAFGTPCPDAVLLVVRGQGYWVPVLAPSTFAVVPLDPIRLILRAASAMVVVLADFWRLAAYGRGGLLWTTPEISWDGVEVTSVEDGTIHGLGWDASTDRKCPFTVDVATGLCRGGAPPRRVRTGSAGSHD